MKKSFIVFFLLSFFTTNVLAQQFEVWGFYKDSVIRYDRQWNVIGTHRYFDSHDATDPEYTWFCDGGNGSYYAFAKVLTTYAPPLIFKNEIIKFDLAGRYYKDLPYRFELSVTGGFVKAGNGKLYALTGKDGSYNKGAIICLDPSDDSVTVVYSFKGDSLGEMPVGGLTDYGNNKLYGVTQQGGAYGKGIVFEYDVLSGSFRKCADFTTATGYKATGTLAKAADGKLYGFTRLSSGSGSNFGYIIAFSPGNDSLYPVYFLGNQGGVQPYNNFFTAASNGKLYAPIYNGVQYNHGSFVEFDPQTKNFAVKGVFNINQNGGYPVGGVVQASNGKIYGTVSRNNSKIFEYDIQKDSFSFYGSTLSGRSFNTLVEVPGGKLLGLNKRATTYSYGSIYIFDYKNYTEDFELSLQILEKRPGLQKQLPTGEVLSVDEIYGINTRKKELFSILSPKNVKCQKRYVVDYPDSVMPYFFRPSVKNMIVSDEHKVFILFHKNAGLNILGTYLQSINLNTYESDSRKLDVDSNTILSLFAFTPPRTLWFHKIMKKGEEWGFVPYNIDTHTFGASVDFADSLKYGYGSLISKKIPGEDNYFCMNYFGGKNKRGIYFLFNPSTRKFKKLSDKNANKFLISSELLSNHFDKVYIINYENSVLPMYISVYSLTKGTYVIKKEAGFVMKNGGYGEAHLMGEKGFMWEASNYDSLFIAEYSPDSNKLSYHYVGKYNGPKKNIKLLCVYDKPLLYNDLKDTSLCSYDTVKFNAQAWPANDIKWYADGTEEGRGATFELSGARGNVSGNYYCIASNYYDKTSSDTAFIKIRKALHPLGNDTALSSDQGLFLDAGAGYNSYLWNNGATTRTFYADKTNLHPGDNLISVKATGFWKCMMLDSVKVYYSAAEESVDGIKVYPNPATDFVNVDFDGGKYGTMDYVLSSAAGKVLRKGELKGTVNKHRIYLPQGLNRKGIYFLKLIPLHGNVLKIKLEVVGG